MVNNCIDDDDDDDDDNNSSEEDMTKFLNVLLVIKMVFMFFTYLFLCGLR